MRSQTAKTLVYSVSLILLVSACGGGRSKIRMQQRDLSVRSEGSLDSEPYASSDAELENALNELEAARKQLAELQKAKTNNADPAEITKLQAEVEKANERVVAAESELSKKDKDSKDVLDKMKRDLLGFYIQYKHSSKCLEVDAASVVDGARLIQMPCVQSVIQRFRLVDRTSGKWIQNIATGKCLTTLAAGTDNSTPVVQGTCVDNGSMLHTLQSDGNGYSFMRNVASNRCVDIAAISQDDRAGAQIYDCLNGDAQRIKMIQAAQ